MKKYRCPICGYVYDPKRGDPENGFPQGTDFDDIPQGWICPVCGEQKWVMEEDEGECPDEDS